MDLRRGSGVMVGGDLTQILPELARGGGPSAGWWRGGRAQAAAGVKTPLRQPPAASATSPSKLREDLA